MSFVRRCLVCAVVLSSSLLLSASAFGAAAPRSATAVPESGTQEGVVAARGGQAEGTSLEVDDYVLPDPEVRDIFATDKNYATLDDLGPDGDHFLVPLVTELSNLEKMARPTYRLATLELRPQTDRLWHLDTFGIYGLRIYSLSARSFHYVQLPEDIFVSDVTWSPDGGRIAFLAHFDDGTRVWTADVATGAAEQLSGARVMATIATRSQLDTGSPSRMVQWTPDGTVITLLVPPARGPEPTADPIPTGPMVRRSREEPLPSRTTQNLLENEHDAALFKYYTTSRIAELGAGEPRMIGEPGIYTSISLSPGGGHLIVEKVEEPFSYLVGYNAFAQKTEIVDAATGSVVETLVDRPLREGGGFGGGNGDDPREFAWRPDGAGITYLQREPRGAAPAVTRDGEAQDDAQDDAPRRDRIMLLPPPFDFDDAIVVASSDDPLSGHLFSRDGNHAFASVRRGGRSGLAHFDLTAADPAAQLIVDLHEGDDPTALPGDLWTSRTANGIEYAAVSTDGTAAFLEGDGYSEDFRPQPFVDRVSLADGGTERIFEGSRDSFDQPLTPLDDDFSRMTVSRESTTDFPDSFLWQSRPAGAQAGSFENLTDNVDPFPEVTAARRVDFEFTRRDGLVGQGRISLPVGYRDGERVPAVFWTYPREYTSEEAYQRAAIRARNHNEHTQMSWLRWSDIWLTQGYALVYPDVPIIGEPYNDRFIPDMRDSMYAAIRAVDRMGYVDVDRIGHGGHSYGAFTTANILAHAPFFKAGIAGDGAYNRSLTPGGFQSERRSVWEAPHIYQEIAPFFSADQIDAPMLMYHGGADNNSGTWPIQSQRMIQALTGLGKTAVLYEYPFESHTPRAIENKLDMWARFLDWFDTYVKGEGEETNPGGSGQW